MTIDLYIENSIIPQYAAFDEAHNVEHVNRVIDESLKLAEEYGVNPEMCYVIAAFHDIGMPFGRKEHHLNSAKILREDRAIRMWFNEKQINIMAEAIEDHRASADNPPRSIYGAIVAEADRDLRPEVPLRRTIQYGLSNYPNEDYEFHKQRTIQHLTEKYGRNGYLKLPLNSQTNIEGLEQLRQIIESQELFNQKFHEMWERLTTK